MSENTHSLRKGEVSLQNQQQIYLFGQIQTSQTGGQLYCDVVSFIFLCLIPKSRCLLQKASVPHQFFAHQMVLESLDLRPKLMSVVLACLDIDISMFVASMQNVQNGRGTLLQKSSKRRSFSMQNVDWLQHKILVVPIELLWHRQIERTWHSIIRLPLVWAMT